MSDAGGKSEVQLRSDAEAILRAAIEAVDPERLTARAIRELARSIPSEGRVLVVGAGKSAAHMARGIHKEIGDRVDSGVLVVPAGTQHYVSPKFEVFYGGHPIPDQGSVAGSRAIRALVREAEERDIVICLLSGGGSSLLTVPPDGLPLEEIQEVSRLLLKCGAAIADINCVRRHLDSVKGGRLALEAAPARIIGLVLSDVAGDPLDVIASGPISPDRTRFSDAVAVLKRHRVWPEVPLAVRGHLDRGLCGEIEDTPDKSHKVFLRTQTVVVGSGETAARAACAEAERLGYESQLLTHTLGGEAREAGGFLAETARILRYSQTSERSPTCVITTGETTVTLRGDGRGGRNQELALGAALELNDLGQVLIASMGTDGIDGPTDAAGAIATGTTIARARELGLDCEQSLSRNDVYPVFEKLDDLILSGPTGTNVADIQVLLLD